MVNFLFSMATLKNVNITKLTQVLTCIDNNYIDFIKLI